MNNNNNEGYFKQPEDNNTNKVNNSKQGYFKAPEQCDGQVNKNYFKKNPQEMQYNFPKKSTGTVSLVLGILSLVTTLGLILGIPAIVMGHKNTDPAQKGSATAGIILGWISTIISILFLVFIFWLFWLASETYR